MMLPVFEWLLDGQAFGCGTEREFRHWNAEGVNPEGLQLGRVIAHEPASEDARRSEAWAAA